MAFYLNGNASRFVVPPGIKVPVSNGSGFVSRISAAAISKPVRAYLAFVIVTFRHGVQNNSARF